MQVKTGRYSNGSSGSFLIGLKTAGGNKYYSGGNYDIKHFDKSRSDLLFIYTADEKMYIIPTKDINVVSSITVGIEKTKKYEVKRKELKDIKDNE